MSAARTLTLAGMALALLAAGLAAAPASAQTQTQDGEHYSVDEIVRTGGAFFGESMFSLVPNGSKVALIALAQYMAENGGRLIDCQFETPHLKSMGGCHITYEQYMEILDDDEP